MRRLLSLVLLAAFALPMAAPLLALAQDPNAGLPACCRRHGAHHCTMQASEKNAANTAPRIGAVCPYFPLHSAPWSASTYLLVLSPAQAATPLYSQLAAAGRVETHRPVTFQRSHPKRGPPALL